MCEFFTAYLTLCYPGRWKQGEQSNKQNIRQRRTFNELDEIDKINKKTVVMF
tara:strand:- start:7256 stop:7411 length:156 start_codon:yes stop_codon:yes gene_type:complete